MGFDRVVGRSATHVAHLLQKREPRRQRGTESGETDPELTDLFMMEEVLGLTHVFEDPDVPERQTLFGQRNIHDEHVVVELVHPRGLFPEAAELPDRVDVEDEQPPFIEMVVHGGERRLPGIEGDEVIEAVEHADDHVEAFAERERAHVPLDQVGPRDLAPGQRQHLRRLVQAGQRPNAREMGEDGPGATTELEERGRARQMTVDEIQHTRRPRRWIIHRRVVEAGEPFIRWHRATVPQCGRGLHPQFSFPAAIARSGRE